MTMRMTPNWSMSWKDCSVSFLCSHTMRIRRTLTSHDGGNLLNISPVGQRERHDNCSRSINMGTIGSDFPNMWKEPSYIGLFTLKECLTPTWGKIQKMIDSQCENYINLLALRFYVKSESKNLPFCKNLEVQILNFRILIVMNVCTFRRVKLTKLTKLRASIMAKKAVFETSRFSKIDFT